MPVSTRNLLGSTFGGRFRLDRLLGAGATASVYQATDVKANRLAAVKILRSTLPAHLHKFQEEGKLGLKLHHPAIVETYAFGISDVPMWLAMEFLEGSNLRTYLERHGPVLPRKASYLAAGQVLLALDYAHGLGIIHHDVRPENVMVVQKPNGAMVTAKLADFGLASHRELGRDLPTQRGGTTLGPLAYLAPELMLGLDSGPASDMYAFGVVLGELLVGHPPLREDVGILSEGADLSRGAVTDDIPAPFVKLLEQLLAPNPRRRIRSAQTAAPLVAKAFAELMALEQPRTDEPVETPTAPGPVSPARSRSRQSR